MRRAAARLRAGIDDLRVVNGAVQASGTRSVDIGVLAAEAPVALVVDAAAPVKPPAAYKLVGTSVPRIDIPGKVTATFTFMQDFRLPSMLHGRVVRPPAVGATLLSVDETSVRSLPGNVKVVRIANFLGVVADTEWAAIKAAQTLAATWSDVGNLPDEAQLFDYVRATPVSHEVVTSNVGDAPDALAQAGRRLSATYDFAIHTHGSIGPSCAVAQVKDGQVTCWTASQATHNLCKQLAASLSVPAAQVRCIYLAGAGCYGRNGHEDAAADAVLLARAVGRPVRVQWMRQDEHGWDPKGAPALIDMQGTVDDHGRVSAWLGTFFYPDSTATNVTLLASDLAGLPSDAGMNPGGVLNDTAIPYRCANIRTVVRQLATTRCGRPGSARLGGCRTPSPMRLSSTSSRCWRGRIPWICASKASTTNGRQRCWSVSRVYPVGARGPERTPARRSRWGWGWRMSTMSCPAPTSPAWRRSK
jgi:nicotinate dehydrogenase subunit B